MGYMATGNLTDFDSLVQLKTEGTFLKKWAGIRVDANIKLYDNLEKGKYLGETLDNKLYMVFKKEGKIVDYKNYI